MTLQEFETAFDNMELEDYYAEYIEANACIGNGHMLVIAMESGNYYEGFRDKMVDSETV
jgi:hypothetical protein